MRSLVLVVSMLLMGITVSHAGLLQEHVRAVEGKVLSKDSSSKRISIQVGGDSSSRDFIADDAQLSMVNPGNTVFILHHDGSNQINFMRILN